MSFTANREFFFLLVLVTACQLFITSCSPRIYREASVKNIESRVEKKQLKVFMDEGTEKKLDTHSATPDDIIETARRYIGVPHCMGGMTMKCMDCSGLLVTVFATHDIKLPHSSEEQARYGKIITGMANLKKGDMVFFIRSYRTNQFITHSGIYTGDGKFIHTSSSNGVTVTSLNDPWWSERYLFATRVFD